MFIFSPSVAEKQPRVLKIVFVTGKMTNVMEYITFFDFAAYRTSIEPRIDDATDLGLKKA